ncbi:hypothetical protein H6G80_04165 [Nostoc sp. FACHB-87]|uniref:hypothetical protein n=1 Tax=Nostocales TaxID=1161 RepID=UPI001683844B|nr:MULTISPECIES: hypothetical protein [Nostocales]MBD2453270.1 hypothetical protein [Nostoc sp. FACHB-87]MBD2474950.1 hypothetical protein [Anabaena sp. FACHB-83]MBD2491444.1 hypothetical protein [Aulosira sp. FACHB-615]
MLILITIGLFFIVGLIVVETIQKFHPANPIINPVWEALCLGITSRFWMWLFREAQIKSEWLIVSAIFGSVLAMTSSLIFWYVHDSTGKSKYTLRNAYLLVGLYRFVLYSISITLGVFLS